MFLPKQILVNSHSDLNLTCTLYKVHPRKINTKAKFGLGCRFFSFKRLEKYV